MSVGAEPGSNGQHHPKDEQSTAKDVTGHTRRDSSVESAARLPKVKSVPLRVNKSKAGIEIVSGSPLGDKIRRAVQKKAGEKGSDPSFTTHMTLPSETLLHLSDTKTMDLAAVPGVTQKENGLRVRVRYFFDGGTFFLLKDKSSESSKADSNGQAAQRNGKAHNAINGSTGIEGDIAQWLSGKGGDRNGQAPRNSAPSKKPVAAQEVSEAESDDGSATEDASASDPNVSGRKKQKPMTLAEARAKSGQPALEKPQAENSQLAAEETLRRLMRGGGR